MNSSTQARPRCAGTRLTRIAVTIGMVVASTGAAITVAAPAHASVDQGEVDGIGLGSESATASCDAGEYLTGGAGGIRRGGREVTLTAIIPDLTTESVTVWAHTNPNAGGATAYRVVAQAMCVSGSPPPDRYLEEKATALNADIYKEAVAICREGTRLLGTGAALEDEFGQPLGELFLRHNFPNVALTTNTVRADAAFGFGGLWKAVSYAICATPPGDEPHRPAQGNIGGPSDANSKTASTAGPDLCGAGELTTGVGGAAAPQLVSIGGFVFINRISTDQALQNNATARAVEGQNLGAGVTWYVAAYNICWRL